MFEVDLFLADILEQNEAFISGDLDQEDIDNAMNAYRPHILNAIRTGTIPVKDFGRLIRETSKANLITVEESRDWKRQLQENRRTFLAGSGKDNNSSTGSTNVESLVVKQATNIKLQRSLIGTGNISNSGNSTVVKTDASKEKGMRICLKLCLICRRLIKFITDRVKLQMQKACLKRKDLAINQLLEYAVRLPEAEHYYDHLSQSCPSPIRVAFQEPYIFLDRFTKAKKSNIHIAQGAANRFSEEFEVEAPVRLIIMEKPRGDSAILDAIKIPDREFLDTEKTIKSAVLCYHPGRAFTSYREVLALRKFFDARGIILYSVFNRELIAVSAENCQMLCVMAKTDSVIASGKGQKGQDKRKAVKEREKQRTNGS